MFSKCFICIYLKKIFLNIWIGCFQNYVFSQIIISHFLTLSVPLAGSCWWYNGRLCCPPSHTAHSPPVQHYLQQIINIGINITIIVCWDTYQNALFSEISMPLHWRGVEKFWRWDLEVSGWVGEVKHNRFESSGVAQMMMMVMMLPFEEILSKADWESWASSEMRFLKALDMQLPANTIQSPSFSCVQIDWVYVLDDD